MKQSMRNIENLPSLSSNSVTLADAHTEIKSNSVYFTTSAIQSERADGFRKNDNVQIVSTVSISEIQSGILWGDIRYNCNGKYITLTLKHEEGKIIVGTPSGTISLLQSSMNFNSSNVRTDVDVVLKVIAYREFGYSVRCGSDDRGIRFPLRQHRTLLKHKPIYKEQRDHV